MEPYIEFIGTLQNSGFGLVKVVRQPGRMNSKPVLGQPQEPQFIETAIYPYHGIYPFKGPLHLSLPPYLYLYPLLRSPIYIPLKGALKFPVTLESSGTHRAWRLRSASLDRLLQGSDLVHRSRAWGGCLDVI